VPHVNYGLFVSEQRRDTRGLAQPHAQNQRGNEKERKTGRWSISALKGAIMWENRNYLI